MAAKFFFNESDRYKRNYWHMETFNGFRYCALALVMFLVLSFSKWARNLLEDTIVSIVAI